MDRINLAKVRHKWRAILNTVMKFKVLSNAGNFLAGSRTSSVSRRTAVLRGDGPLSKEQSVNCSDGIATNNVCVCVYVYVCVAG